MTGRPLREVAELDEDEYLALRAAAMERERVLTWRNNEELLATLIDTVNALRAELAAGLPVVQIAKTLDPEQPQLYPRPEWVETVEQKDPNEIVMKPRDLARKMMRKK